MTRRIVVTILCCTAVLGCHDDDERLTEFAREAAHEQAQQSERVAEASRRMAEAHGRLIEADAEARSQLITLQQDLRTDQAEVQQQRNHLESERREIADERRTDSAVGQGIVTLAILLACLSPLILAAASIMGIFAEPTDGEVCEMLLSELPQPGMSRLPAENEPALPRAADGEP